jgi:hypothetical protein
MLRYYDTKVLPDGTVQQVQKAHKLIEAEGEYRSKKAAHVLADEFLAPLNNGNATPQSTMTLTQLVENTYLPFVETHKRISTFRGYRSLWRCYLKPWAEKPLRDFRTVDGERLLLEIAKSELTCSIGPFQVRSYDRWRPLAPVRSRRPDLQARSS